MRWVPMALIWLLLVRLWFHGPVRLGHWTLIPDTGWLLGLLTVSVVGATIWAYGRWDVVLQGLRGLRPRTVGTWLLSGLLLLGWVGLTAGAVRARVPRGFTATYYGQARPEGEPFIRGIQADLTVRPEWVPTPGQPFAVLWQGYFWVDRPERYELNVEAVDGAVVWLAPVERAESPPVGWGQASVGSWTSRPDGMSCRSS